MGYPPGHQPAALLSLGTATPPFKIVQESFASRMAIALRLDERQTDWLKRLYKNSGIQHRYTVFEEFMHEPQQWTFWGSDPIRSSPGTFMRNEVYKKEAHVLALQSAQRALDEWGGNPDDISHLIYVSCTGVTAPGIQQRIRPELHLRPNVNLIGLNLMGCFGMLKAIDLAAAYAQQSPRHRILIVSTELCSLHFQPSLQAEAHVTNALFADGASAAVIGCDPKDFELPLWSVEKVASATVDNTLDCMTWNATDCGFHMGLKREVPIHLRQSIAPFVESLLGHDYSIEDYDWAVHPGGVGILKAVQESLGLDDHQLFASSAVLRDFGNMSSSTFMFVLDQLRKEGMKKKWAVGLGFGPGLTVEGLLLKQAVL